ncbi:MAG UNVERIFIED_CONTAM: hypothetical protein LVR18_22125 [Planctomycetaceae bacterium]
MESDGNPDTVYVELEATGLLETVNGSISLSPGARTVLRGDVKAGGPTSDVTVTAAESIDLRGSLTAGRDILVHAGTDVVPGTASIRTFATSTLKTEHGGQNSSDRCQRCDHQQRHWHRQWPCVADGSHLHQRQYGAGQGLRPH